MDLQHLNLGSNAPLLLVGLCILCLVLPILLTGLNLITGVATAITHLFAGVLHIISGGPAQWCGCLVAIAGCGVVAFAVWLLVNGLSNCSTYSTNFCALFGR